MSDNIDSLKMNQSSNLEKRSNKSEYAIEMLGIHKEFLGGRIIAIDNIDFRVKTGTIHALIGENGSGKSTLMNTIFGIYSLDQGSMRLFGEKQVVKDSRHANELGIGMVHQHFKLVDRFTVLENIIMGQEPVNNKVIIDMNEARRKYKEVTERFNLIVDPDLKVSDLPVDLKQKVEIIKVLWNPKKVLIFDEPTASLGNDEIKAFLNTLKQLRSEGITIIFTSHKLDEIKYVADEATVLTNGSSVLRKKINADTSTDDIIKYMIGEKVVLDFKEDKKHQVIEKDNIVLETKDLSLKNSDGAVKLDNVSIKLRKGEIFGIAGIADNGQTELVNSIAGLLQDEYKTYIEKEYTEKSDDNSLITKLDLYMKNKSEYLYEKLNIKKNDKKSFNRGKVFINGEDYTSRNIAKRNDVLSFVPGDRLKWGVSSQLSLMDNATFKDINSKKFSKWYVSKLDDGVETSGYNMIINKDNSSRYTENILSKYDVRGWSETNDDFMVLSGGNQQKFIVGRELTRPHEIMLASYPTRGLDIKAIYNLYKLIIQDVVENQRTTLLFSHEIDELVAVCDRIAVIDRGRIIEIIENDGPKKSVVDKISNHIMGVTP